LIVYDGFRADILAVEAAGQVFCERRPSRQRMTRK
jgi:hypothetical protein